MTRALYEQEVVRRILMVREDLVRHDENAAAWTLMDECVPYFVRDHPEIAAARERQRAMVAHLLDPDAYRHYYAANPHERPFEQQYGVPVEEAHRIPRIAFLRTALTTMHRELGRELRVLDLGANDGFLAANLASLDIPIVVDCVDLHPGNCELARKRAERYPTIGTVIEGNAVATAREREGDYYYDAVVAFELIEHVPDPAELLDAMRCAISPKHGHLFVSTPNGAVEDGNLPDWDRVERKGHLRALRIKDLRELCEQVGKIEQLVVGADNVIVAQVRPRQEREREPAA